MSYSDIRQDVLTTMGFFWSRLFQNAGFVEAFTKVLSIHLADLERMTEELPAYLSREDIPVFDEQEVHLFEFNEENLEQQVYDYGASGLTYDDAGLLFGQEFSGEPVWAYPITQALSPMYLASDITDDAMIWNRGIDYVVQDGHVIFRTDPLDLDGVARRAVLTEDGKSVFKFFMWGYKTQRDYNAVQDIYGAVAGVAANSSDVYKKAVNIAWDLRTEGASVQNINRVFALAADVDYVEQAGQVEDIFPEGDRICVLTENAVYTAPIGTETVVSVGAQIEVGERIFDAFSIEHSSETISFSYFEALLLDPGFLGMDYSTPLLIPNTMVTVEKIHDPDWTYVEHTD